MAAAAGNGATDVPEPVVKIDNEADPFATVVTIQFGDRLGELLDTVGAACGCLLPARPKVACGRWLQQVLPQM